MKKQISLISVFLFIFLTIQAQPVHAESVEDTAKPSLLLQSNLSNFQAYAELYRDKKTSYKGVCLSEDFKYVLDRIKMDLKAKTICNSNEKTFVIESRLKGDKEYYCADNTGLVTTNKKSQGKKATSCVPVTKGTADITKDDHFLSGNINSPVKVLTYSDIECPFCKGFNQTVQKLIGEYEDDVAFVYRHYPLTQIHQGAELAANATECAAKLGGESKFSEYLDSVFEISPNLSVEALSDLAGDVGITEKTFTSCLKSKKYSKEVKNDMKEGDKIAKKENMFGTPYSIVYGPNNKMNTIAGNQPYADIKQILDGLLKK